MEAESFGAWRRSVLRTAHVTQLILSQDAAIKEEGGNETIGTPDQKTVKTGDCIPLQIEAKWFSPAAECGIISKVVGLNLSHARSH